jgi:protein regulator of cytokinesis 1
VEEYSKIKESRLHRLAELESKEGLLCDALGMQSQANFGNELPSEQQLDEFEAYIKDKHLEKEQLLEEYRESKSAIIGNMRELNVTPDSEFEKLVIYEEDTAFSPTRNNMIELRELNQRLEHQLEEINAEIIWLLHRIFRICDRLRKNDSYRNRFLSAHGDYPGDTLNDLREV